MLYKVNHLSFFNFYIMKKTLLVHYLPRGERSKTKLLVDHFKKVSAGKTEIEELNLITDTPDMFLEENLMAHVLRDMAGQTLTPAQAKSLEKFDRLTAQIMAADNVVLAFPMYNFSFPAVVKAWFDSVMLKGKTWDMDSSGCIGLLKGKKALLLSTSGGVYSEEMKTIGWDHAFSLGATEFGFMGFETTVVTAQGMNMFPAEKVDEAIQQSEQKIDEVVKKWF